MIITIRSGVAAVRSKNGYLYAAESNYALVALGLPVFSNQLRESIKNQKYMRSLYFFLSISSIVVFSACGGGMDTGNQDGTAKTDTSQTQADEDTSGLAAVPARPDCAIAGEVLPENQSWSREHNLIIAIVADSTTYDENLGESHRILEVYDANTCDRIDRQVLPVNVSPDFPYYLAKINYNNNSRMMAIRGFDKVYLYNLANRKLLPALTPRYSGEHYAADAQSGMILRLELWEQYLVGAAQDLGVFVFDLNDRQNPKPVLPFAEYEISETDFGSLFLVSSMNNGQQIIMPSFDADNDEFSINPLFTQPKELNTSGISASARNNRYLVIREANDARTPVAIDLQERKLVSLPADVANKTTQQILQWMREN